MASTSCTACLRCGGPLGPPPPTPPRKHSPLTHPSLSPHLTLQLLGTPSLTEWPELHTLPDYGKITFPHQAGRPLAASLPDGGAAALALLGRLLAINPAARPSAAEALDDPYFGSDASRSAGSDDSRSGGGPGPATPAEIAAELRLPELAAARARGGNGENGGCGGGGGGDWAELQCCRCCCRCDAAPPLTSTGGGMGGGIGCSDEGGCADGSGGRFFGDGDGGEARAFPGQGCWSLAVDPPPPATYDHPDEGGDMGGREVAGTSGRGLPRGTAGDGCLDGGDGRWGDRESDGRGGGGGGGGGGEGGRERDRGHGPGKRGPGRGDSGRGGPGRGGPGPLGVESPLRLPALSVAAADLAGGEGDFYY